MNRVPKLLAVIDYQNDFVTGSLGFEGAAAPSAIRFPVD